MVSYLLHLYPDVVALLDPQLPAELAWYGYPVKSLDTAD
jgi:hypothetical protein